MKYTKISLITKRYGTLFHRKKSERSLTSLPSFHRNYFKKLSMKMNDLTNDNDY